MVICITTMHHMQKHYGHPCHTSSLLQTQLPGPNQSNSGLHTCPMTQQIHAEYSLWILSFQDNQWFKLNLWAVPPFVSQLKRVLTRSFLWIEWVLHFHWHSVQSPGCCWCHVQTDSWSQLGRGCPGPWKLTGFNNNLSIIIFKRWTKCISYICAYM